ncbi:MAG: hypothetical protein R3C59_25895 [Planctomycetaceae bacterium]
MVCSHLKQLYQLCEDNQLRLGGSDLVRIVCRQCDETETCPSVLMDEYDAHEEQKARQSAKDSAHSPENATSAGS